MKKVFIITALVLGLAGLLTYQMFSLAQIECSLCITFKGVKVCRKALGPNEQEAQEEAHRHACAEITSGVTEVVACNRLKREDLRCYRP